MLVSDVFEVPHEKLADWTAPIGSAVAYLIFAMVVFYGLRIFFTRTRMRLLGNLIAAMVLVAGLVGYFEVFVALDGATFSRAVAAVLPRAGGEAQLARLSNERARSIRDAGGAIESRRVGFYLLPVVAVAFAAMLVRARTERR
jgi:hypothetical protein